MSDLIRNLDLVSSKDDVLLVLQREFPNHRIRRVDVSRHSQLDDLHLSDFWAIWTDEAHLVAIATYYAAFAQVEIAAAEAASEDALALAYLEAGASSWAAAEALAAIRKRGPVMPSSTAEG